MLTHASFLLTGPDHGRAFEADATFRADGVAKPVVIFVHGFKGFKDWGHFPLLADFFAERGFVFVKLNLSHNGIVVGGTGDLEDLEAFGRNNFSIELDDIGQVIEALFAGKSPVPAAEMDLQRMGLVGHSRGGGLVLLKAAEDPRVRAVATWAAIAEVHPHWPQAIFDEWERTGILHVPNTRTGQQLPMHYQIVEDYHAHRPRLDIAHNVRRKLRQPLLIVHGDQDETVNVAAAHTLHQLRPDAELLLLPDATHMFGGAHPWAKNELPEPARFVAERTADFFLRHL
ncbi:prolyl oligopeptidase family serine peptidase [Hymenobacter sp. M29]|uniref:Prolyl oligopeptidase family serine peptidase n=1 Tax=Hymenobacter mellowenesis TaxID=3063995 RepID=A0ABT9A925_9BACT|nr:prolyl oligopeptidase family serine peptidase [Hymenobacter sp. M29]MDO7846342.1 prolyl oligopeptidase family serine peptidase [Hymenobacter sp. M29]